MYEDCFESKINGKSCIKGNKIYGIGNIRVSVHYTHWIVNNLDCNSVLDIGCADGIIESVLENKKYIGVDIGADIYKRSEKENIFYIENYEELKSFIKKNTVDFTILYDVLEHTFDFTDLFISALESSNKYCLVSLPNEENIRNRIAFLFGKGLEIHKLDMYGKHVNHRHLWLIQINKAIKILEKEANKFGFEIDKIYYYHSLPTTKYKQYIYKFVTDKLPESLSSSGFAVLFRKI